MDAKEEKISMVKHVLDTLKDDELEDYYLTWITSISKSTKKEDIISELEKHWKEENIGSPGWLVNAVNLMRICDSVFGFSCGEHPEILKDYKLQIMGYKIKTGTRKTPAKERIELLLNNYINYPEKAIEPPEMK